MDTTKRLTLLLGAICTLSFLFNACPAPGDVIIAEARPGLAPRVTSHTIAPHGGINGPRKDYFQKATVTDSHANPQKKQDMATTKYPVPIVDGNSKEMIVKNKGVMYEGEADAFLVFGPGTWDSSFSSAKVSRIADAPFTQGERIIANATVTDPAEYTATFDLMFPPEIVISLELADLNLTAISTAPGESTFASISGFYETDLLDDGFLWSFRWEASSSDPDKSVFTFNSNPLLGLDDDALSDQFLSMVSSASGVHALLGSFLVEVSIFPTLSPGQDTLDFIFGGTNEYFAEARTVPEPSTLSLIASAAIMITCGYACARARKHPS